jgi:hypothetical protein
MTVDDMTVDDMTVNDMTVDDMTVNDMTVDDMTASGTVTGRSRWRLLPNGRTWQVRDLRRQLERGIVVITATICV